MTLSGLMGDGFARLDARAIAVAVGAGEVSAVEVARAALARVSAYDRVQPAVWIMRLGEEDVLRAAAETDRRVRAGERLALAGAPFAVKDNLDVEGLETTAGCPAFAYRAGETAEVAARLIAAGAVLIGKTNLDQFATGLVGARSPYGACGSVYNRAFVSGGSSAGSAVAVAAGLVAFALGTDTAGSGRVPAAFNGLVGLKPTRGRWSARGLVPACRTLDCVTVFASTVDDAALVDDVVKGFDAADPYSRRDGEGRAAAARFPPAFRFGAPARAKLDWFSDPASPGLFEAAVARLRALGGTEVEIDETPLAAAAELLYGGPFVAERAAAALPLLTRRPGALHPVVRGILEGGLRVMGVDAFRGLYALEGYRRAAERMWEEIDVLILPPAPRTYRIAEVLAEPLALNATLGRYTNFVNLLDMSALALPAGFRQDATAFGVTLIGPAWADAALMDLGRRYEEIAPMPAPPPLDLEGTPERVRLAVVGAHLAAMPLHWQLTSRNAALHRRCRTAPVYRLYAMAGAAPPKPALTHVGAAGGGAMIEVEVYELDVAAFGSFTAEVPAPLAIGTVTLEDGAQVKGFVAEPRALEGAEDITHLGGWRPYIAREAAKAEGRAS